MQGPLSDLRVLEFDDGLGQFCGKLLADLGATVVKIEPPGGSPSRRVGPFLDNEPGVDRSLTFWHYNTNKRSVVLDVTNRAAQDVILDLVNEYDVVIDATVAGLASVGLGADELRARNDRLVFLRTTAFGETGPYAGYKGSDAVSLALAGLTAMNGYDGHENLPPITPDGGQAAHLAGMMSAIGLLGAIFHRDRTGDGQDVAVNAHDAIAVSTELSVPYWEYKKARVYRQTSRHARPDPRTPPQVARCKDGKYIAALSLYLFDKVRFPAMVEWLDSAGMADDLKDERYKDESFQRANLLHINAVVHKFCAAHDSAWLFHEAQKRRLPWAPLNYPGELPADPHLVARGAFTSIDDKVAGREVVHAGRPYVFSETPWSLRSPPPRLGEHTVETLAKTGRGKPERERLFEAGATQ